jgi:hypothetical protein
MYKGYWQIEDEYAEKPEQEVEEYAEHEREQAKEGTFGNANRQWLFGRRVCALIDRLPPTATKQE